MNCFPFWVLWLGLGILSQVSSAQSPLPIKIMSVGGTGVYGDISGTGPGYHPTLLQELASPAVSGSQAFAVTFLGDKTAQQGNQQFRFVSQNGALIDNTVGGPVYWDFRETPKGLVNAFLPGATVLPPAAPDCIILWAGETGLQYADATVGYDPDTHQAEQATTWRHQLQGTNPLPCDPLHQRIMTTTNYLLAKFPAAQVLVFTIQANGVAPTAENLRTIAQKNEQIDYVNQQLQNATTGIPSLGSRAHVFPIHTHLLAPEDYQPNYVGEGNYLFPNDAGYNKIGPALAQSIREIFSGPQAPVISSALTATATQGASFSYQIAAINTPTSFGASNLPTGFSVNAAGLITSNSVTAAIGSYNLTISANNTLGTDAKTLVLTVVPPPPQITSLLAASAPQGSAFTYQITASNLPTSFGATDLPAGFGINASGLITANPLTADLGSYNVTITASNAGGTDTETLAITVSAPSGTTPAITSSLQPQRVRLGASFSYQMTATNNPTSFLATGLPPGFSKNAAGLITANPVTAAPGVYPIGLSATNGSGMGPQSTLTVTVALAKLADTESDGLSTLLEEYCATDPMVSDDRLAFRDATCRLDNLFVLTHQRKKPVPSWITSAAYQWSTDMVNWQASGASFGGQTVTISANVFDIPFADYDIVEASFSTTGVVGPCFLRLVVTGN